MTPGPNNKSPADLTANVGAATDIVPLGQPVMETVQQPPDWDKIAALEEFRALLKAKLKFIAPATLFFIVYYFALPVLVGYAPALMQKTVFGVVNLAYLFALSQFVMAWTIAALYVRAAGRFDKMAAAILTNLNLK